LADGHTGLGIASLVLGIIATCLFVSPATALSESGRISETIAVLFDWVGMLLGLLALVFGAISYFGKGKDGFGLAGFILGIPSVTVHGIIAVVATF